jgi:probable phosphoglycerate mutase
MPESTETTASDSGPPYRIVFDGGAIGNPGKGYGSYVLYSPTGRQIHERLDYSAEHPVMTNNQAEYRTLIRALAHLREKLGERAPASRVIVQGDSQLVLFQMQGAWKVRNADLRELHGAARAIAEVFAGVTYTWHPRERSVEILGH